MFFLPEQKKNWKLRGGLFNSVTIALKGLDPLKSKIIGLFSHKSIRLLSDYNKEHSNKHYDLDRGLILDEICNQEACYYRILNLFLCSLHTFAVKYFFCLS